jgi:hypothetical protein
MVLSVGHLILPQMYSLEQNQFFYDHTGEEQA